MSGRFRTVSFVACLLATGVVFAEEPNADTLTRELFQNYVVRQGKITTSSVLAATHLVAERGRESGFWKEVLAELKRGNEQSEVGCVRVLGRMLAVDSYARDTIRRQKETGEVAQWVAHVCLGPEVVAELIARGKAANRFQIDHYTIALARARVPEAKEFFVLILENRLAQDNPPVTQKPQATTRRTTTPPNSLAPDRPFPVPHLETTRFHAAVGLAQLGDMRGVDWLIAHCDDTAGSVSNAWPASPGQAGTLGPCCIAALQQLAGNRHLTTRDEWQAWARGVDRKSLADRNVTLLESNAF